MKWINVEEKLPTHNETVLVNCNRERGVTWPDAKFICTATLSLVTRHCGPDSPIDNRWYVQPSGGYEITDCVTHWMPLPEPPE